MWNDTAGIATGSNSLPKPALRAAALMPASLMPAALMLASLLAAPPPAGAAPAKPGPHYDVRATIDPVTHGLRYAVEITGLAPQADLRFVLHGALAATYPGGGAVKSLGPPTDPRRYGINEEGGGDPDVELKEYLVPAARLAAGALSLEVAGVIHHPLASESEEYARSFARTPGTIGEEGVFLSGGTYWLPSFGEGLLTFRLEVALPADWDVVSQGERTVHELTATGRQVVWESKEPMEELYVVGGRFVESSRQAGHAVAQVFLREADPNLANRYLEATAQYLQMYEGLFGPYPFAKFALVENFWETGYGMPSFTLLGPQIIRFPFILTSSYPHEILHNWWGNSVYVDYPSGNWCEGLTAYLADHLMREGQGDGVGYRRDTLKRYANHVRGARDFPLTEFRSRHSSATEAVGYGKSLMLWHMLRMRLGDADFVRGLGRFYRSHKFTRATFGDIERAMSEVAGSDLGPFFRQWVERTGAPELRLDAAATRWDAANRTLTVAIEQVQEGRPYALDVPIAVALAGEPQARSFHLALTGPRAVLQVTLDTAPSAVVVDPGFDLFRRLAREEIPPSLSELFGAERVALVLPAADAAFAADRWRELADAWSGGKEDVVIVRDDAIEALPTDRAVWLLGADNRFARTTFGGLDAYGAAVDGTSASFGSETATVGRADHAFVYTLRHPADPSLGVGWIGAGRADSLAGLARKLPHYGKYSFLAFEGAEPTNVRKGQWPVVGSPLLVRFAEGPMDLPQREPLARPRPVLDPAALVRHVEVLAAPAMAGRGVGTSGIEAAAEYIAAQFAAAGLEPLGDPTAASSAAGGAPSYFQRWQEPGGPGGKPVTLTNVVGVLRGTRPEWAEQSVVLGAHYDHLGLGWPDVRAGHEGQIHPGADDNASGVAVVLELAKLLGTTLQPERSVVFVAFSGEEWNLKGSRHYVAQMQGLPADKALAMINLDTVGRLGGEPLTLFGAGSATEWVHIARGIGFTTGIQSKLVTEDFPASDQQSFLDAGVPAIHVFATAHEDYHRPSDTVDRVDGAGLVKVATWVREAVVYLSERDRPLTSTLAPRGEVAGAGASAATAGDGAESEGGRQVSLGTLPDFEFAGPGVKVVQVLPETAAAAAGLQAGDLLLMIDDEPLLNVRVYADVLRRRKAGDAVAIKLRRGGAEMQVQATLRPR